MLSNYDLYVGILYAITVGFGILGIFVWVKWMKSHPNHKWMALTPLSYLAHVLIYITYRLVAFPVGTVISPDQASFLNLWSNAIRLHSLILLFSAGTVMNAIPSTRRTAEEYILNKAIDITVSNISEKQDG